MASPGADWSDSQSITDDTLLKSDGVIGVTGVSSRDISGG